MESRQEDRGHRVAAAIERKRTEVERRWLERVRCTPDGREANLTELRDAIPDYLAELVDALRRGPDEPIVGRGAGWARIAQLHAVTRVQQGFDVDQLVAEFFELRRVLVEIAREEGALSPEADAEPVSAHIEAAVRTSVRSYVEARDYQARKIEAEHIGFITHELRNPLSVASLGAARLRQLIAPSPDSDKVFDMIERALRSLGGLIDSVLAIEHFEAGSAEVRPVDVGMGELLEQALRAARGVAEAKHIDLVVHGHSDAVLHVDPKLATSALQNVFDNAVKFTDAGAVEVELEEEPDRLVVSVHDNCKGLSPAELRTVFEPFKRGRTGKPGSGLGLAIARRAMEANGGTIRAESSGGRGCKFFLTFPKARH